MIRIEKFSPKQLVIVFLVSLLFGCLIYSWLLSINSPTNYWPFGVDVYPRWVGSRAFWRGESPYTVEVDHEIQDYIYGRPAQVDEPSFGFYYPAYAAIVLAPLAILPVQWAIVLWGGSMWAVLGTAVFMIIQSLPGRTSPWLLAIVALTLALYRPALLCILNGQYAFFIIGIWGLSYYLIRRGHPAAAGFLLALTTIKPSLSFFPLLVFLLWSYNKDHKKVIISFFVTSAIFFLITILRLGWWVPEFFSELSEYGNSSRPWQVDNIVTVPGFIWLVSTLGLIYLGIKEYLKKDFDFLWILFWGSISLNLIVTPHTSEYDMVVLILPFIIYAPGFLQSKKGGASWMFLFWFPWLAMVFLILLDSPTNAWYSNMWLIYPPILMTALLIYFFTDRHKGCQFQDMVDLPG